MGTLLTPKPSAISLRSTRSPVRSFPVNKRWRMCETTRSFSLTPYFFGIFLLSLFHTAFGHLAVRVSHELARAFRGLVDQLNAGPTVQRLSRHLHSASAAVRS